MEQVKQNKQEMVKVPRYVFMELVYSVWPELRSLEDRLGEAAAQAAREESNGDAAGSRDNGS